MIEALLLSVALAGQIIGPDEFPRDTAATYGCTCAYPKDEPDVELSVEYSALPNASGQQLNIYPHPDGDVRVYVVGPPGTYDLYSNAVVLIHETYDYLEPGPNWPDDPADMKRATRRVIKSYDQQNYQRTIRIIGKEDPKPDPDDPPKPDPDDPPTPDGTFKGDIRAALAKVPPADRKKPVKTGDGVSSKPAQAVVADNYLQVADEGTALSWSASEMIDVLKQRNASSLPVATLMAWRPFFIDWNAAASKAGLTTASTTADVAKAFRDTADVLSE